MDEEPGQDEVMLARLAEVLWSESEPDELAMTVAIAMYEEYCKTGSKEQINSAV
jgi:hypothetical protein